MRTSAFIFFMLLLTSCGGISENTENKKTEPAFNIAAAKAHFTEMNKTYGTANAVIEEDTKESLLYNYLIKVKQ
jgi:hypothetical protein